MPYMDFNTSSKPSEWWEARGGPDRWEISGQLKNKPKQDSQAERGGQGEQRNPVWAVRNTSILPTLTHTPGHQRAIGIHSLPPDHGRKTKSPGPRPTMVP